MDRSARTQSQSICLMHTVGTRLHLFELLPTWNTCRGHKICRRFHSFGLHPRRRIFHQRSQYIPPDRSVPHLRLNISRQHMLGIRLDLSELRLQWKSDHLCRQYTRSRLSCLAQPSSIFRLYRQCKRCHSFVLPLLSSICRQSILCTRFHSSELHLR